MNKQLLCLLGLSALFFMGLECQQQEKIREGFFISTNTVAINTGSRPIDRENIPIPQSLKNIYTTGTTNINVPTPTSSATSSISEEIFSSSSINKNNPATWPRFEFKELGFSMQLPVEKGIMNKYYEECKNGKTYNYKEELVNNDSCEEEIENFAMAGAWFKINTSSLRLVSVTARSKNFSKSKNYTDGREIIISDMYDFYVPQIHSNYKEIIQRAKINNPENHILLRVINHPLKILYNQKQLIVIDDLYEEFYKNKEEEFVDKLNKQILYGIYIKLPNNKQFNAVLIEFGSYNDEKPFVLSLKQIEGIAKSIEFLTN